MSARPLNTVRAHFSDSASFASSAASHLRVVAQDAKQRARNARTAAAALGFGVFAMPPLLTPRHW